MTREDAIKLIEIAKAEIEWEYPFDYQVAFDKAIKALEQEPNEPVGNSDKLDCISRDMLLEKMADYVSSGYADSAEDFEEYSKIICQLPSVKPKTEWIPISEKLPEDIRPVIVTWKNNDPESYYHKIAGKHFIGVAHYLKGKWYWYSSTTEDFLAEYGRYEGEEFDEAIEVVAWCELPEPYKMSEIPTGSESESSSEKPNK